MDSPGDSARPDIFVHIKGFRNPISPDDIRPGLEIEFSIESAESGLRAADVVVLEGVR